MVMDELRPFRVTETTTNQFTGTTNKITGTSNQLSFSSEPEQDYKWLLFSIHGRISRGQYWKVSIPLMLATLLPFVALLVYVMDVGAGGFGIVAGVFNSLCALAMFPLMWIGFAIGAKRWHDRNKSAWWMLISIVPYIGGFWQFIELGCLAGSEGENDYGEAPDQ